MMCRLAIAENSSHTEMSASDRLARASGRATANPPSLAVSASQVMTVAERQALMHSFRAISRRNPNAVPWSSALVWVAVVVHRFRQVFAVRVHRVVHCPTFRSVTTRFQLSSFAWLCKVTRQILPLAPSMLFTHSQWTVANDTTEC